MIPPGPSPATFHLQHRTLILTLFPVVAVFSLIMIAENLGSGEPWANWLAALALWIFLFVLALRRHLVINQDGLEFTSVWKPVFVRWARVRRVITRKTLGIWTVEGLEIVTDPPDLNELFIDLTQFGKSWRQDDLGKVLRARAPHLFRESDSSRNAV